VKPGTGHSADAPCDPLCDVCAQLITAQREQRNIDAAVAAERKALVQLINRHMGKPLPVGGIGVLLRLRTDVLDRSGRATAAPCATVVSVDDKRNEAVKLREVLADQVMQFESSSGISIFDVIEVQHGRLAREKAWREALDYIQSQKSAVCTTPEKFSTWANGVVRDLGYVAPEARAHHAGIFLGIAFEMGRRTPKEPSPPAAPETPGPSGSDEAEGQFWQAITQRDEARRDLEIERQATKETLEQAEEDRRRLALERDEAVTKRYDEVTAHARTCQKLHAAQNRAAEVESALAIEKKKAERLLGIIRCGAMGKCVCGTSVVMALPFCSVACLDSALTAEAERLDGGTGKRPEIHGETMKRAYEELDRAHAARAADTEWCFVCRHHTNWVHEPGKPDRCGVCGAHAFDQNGRDRPAGKDPTE
jgi:hypothetical protein